MNNSTLYMMQFIVSKSFCSYDYKSKQSVFYPYSVQQSHGLISRLIGKSNDTGKILWYERPSFRGKVFTVISDKKIQLEEYLSERLNFRSVAIKDSFFKGHTYRFYTCVNPVEKRSGKRMAITDKEAIKKWLERSLSQYGCKLVGDDCSIYTSFVRFRHKRTQDGAEKYETVTLNKCEIEGFIESTSPQGLHELLINGLGKAKAFGFGMFQVSKIN